MDQTVAGRRMMATKALEAATQGLTDCDRQRAVAAVLQMQSLFAGARPFSMEALVSLVERAEELSALLARSQARLRGLSLMDEHHLQETVQDALVSSVVGSGVAILSYAPSLLVSPGVVWAPHQN